MDTARALAFVATCSGIGAFIDFFVGRRGQRNIRERLETWWVKLSDVRISTFARDEAAFTARLLRSYFGPTLSRQRMRSIAAVTSLGSLLWLLLALSDEPAPGELPQVFDVGRLWIFAAQCMFLSLSLTITIWSVQLVTRFIGTNGMKNLCLYLVFTLIQLVLILVILPVQLAVILVPTGYYDGVPIGVAWDFFMQDLSDELKNPKLFTYLTETRLDTTNYFFYLGCFLSFFPGVLRLSLGMIFSLSILAQPLRSGLAHLLLRLGSV